MTDAELTALLDASRDESKKLFAELQENMRIFHEKSEVVSARRKALFTARNKLRGYPPPD